MLAVSAENYVGVWGKISKTGVCACVYVERGSEGKQMGLIFSSALFESSSKCKWIYIYKLADVTVSTHRAKKSMHAHTGAEGSPGLLCPSNLCVPASIFSLKASASPTCFKQPLFQTQCATNLKNKQAKKNPPHHIFTYVFVVLI